ncbi:Oidioi.mRNA.OKI2018_I69.XSR.g13678.t1.cds [Oikopleura dioica]|uniref:Oidioi.mRNA.OKI2018_I69.XSR.g13678.t1.cds n=1 Tax=Oikopleura dioica TaxID=34765 RepID=A0ABN7SBH9_OIKDI|nr:Oidioi.mRNA.OKI2018_I69.XSR.g13678.t1.cds [Oikopleura dioica]
MFNCGAATFEDVMELTPRMEDEEIPCSLPSLGENPSRFMLAVSAGTKRAYDLLFLTVCAYHYCLLSAMRTKESIVNFCHAAKAFFKDFIQLYPDEQQILCKRIFQVYYHTNYGDAIKIFFTFCFAYVLFSFRVY